MKTEKEKMLAGEVYSAVDAEVLRELNAVKDVVWEYNQLRPSEAARRLEILKGLLAAIVASELEMSTYDVLRITGVSLFDKTPLRELLRDEPQEGHEESGGQLWLEFEE